MQTERIKRFINNCVQITIITEVLLLIGVLIAMVFDILFALGLEGEIMGALIFFGIMIPVFASVLIIIISMVMMITHQLVNKKNEKQEE